MAEKVCGMNDNGARLMEGRIEKVGAQLAQAEARLAEVERSLAELKRSELDIGWVAKHAHIDADTSRHAALLAAVPAHVRQVRCAGSSLAPCLAGVSTPL